MDRLGVRDRKARTGRQGRRSDPRTSVWRWALKRTRPHAAAERQRWDEAQGLADVLDRELAVGHLWIYAELLLGGMPDHAARLYRQLPHARPVSASALIEMIQQTRPAGVGWVDLALFGAALRDGLSIWTLDTRRLDRATELGVAWRPPART